MKKYYKVLLTLFASLCIVFHNIPLKLSHVHNDKNFEAKQIHKEFKPNPTFLGLLKFNKLHKEEIKVEMPVVIKQKSPINTSNVSRGGNLEIETVDQQIQSPDGWFDVEISFYTNDYHDCQSTLGITASGKHVNSNTIATPRNIPFNTAIYIKDQGLKVVQDRGGAIRYKSDGVMKIDVFVEGASQIELNKMGIIHTVAKIIKPIK